MTLIEGELDTDDKEEILEQIVSNAEESFSREFSEDEAVIIREIYEPVAEYLALQQQDIKDVLQSTRLETAEDQSLDFIGNRVGVPRFKKRAAKTGIEFISSSPISQGNSYTIPEGQGVQTDDADPIKFETDEGRQLRFLDGFEDNDIAEYSGDTGSFAVQGTTVYEGSYALEGTSSTGQIFDTGNEVPEGSVVHWRNYMNTGTEAGFLFAVQDSSNYYQINVDENNGAIRIDKVDSGSTTNLASTTVTVPTGAWIHGELDWDHDAEITFTLYDSSGNKVGDVSATDTDAVIYRKGGIGFASLDANAKKYWDNATMSSISVPSTATTAGADTNVGSNTLIVLSTSVSGVDDVTNPIPATGGRDRELDESYRDRVRRQLSEGSKASQPALIHHLDNIPEVKSVTVIVNDTSSQDAAGRPSHTFEAVTDMLDTSQNRQAVAEVLLDKKAAGDVPVGGYAGTAVTESVEMSNGQSKVIEWSLPTQVKIYIDCDLTKTSTYEGDEAVRNSVVQYLSGDLSDGTATDGELDVGDDVIYNQVIEAIMDVPGVHDITNLEIGTSSDPTGTSNISIGSTDTAYGDATDTSLDVTSSDA